MTATYDFTMVRGDTKRLEVTVRDEAGAIVNITSASIRWWMAKTVNATAFTLQKAVGSGVTVVDAAAGRFDVLLVATDTRTLTPGAYYHECEVVDSGGQVSTVFRGALVLEKDLVSP
jgi:hypothetical protein